MSQGVNPLEEEGVIPSSTTHDVCLSSGIVIAKNVPSKYSLVVKNDLSRFRNDRAIANAVKK